MELKVFNSTTIVEQRKANKARPVAVLFDGRKEANLKATNAVPVIAMASPKEWEDMGHEARMMALEGMRSVVMQANPPAASVIEDFFGKFFIEVTRRANESPDLTSLIAREVTDFNMPENPNLRDLTPFRGRMRKVSGGNDPVPLIEQNTGNLDPMAIEIYAVGWKDSIKNTLFNQFFTMDKVIQAAVDSYVDNRNNLIIGYLAGITFDNSQKQAAHVDTDQSLDANTYETMRDGVALLKSLLDRQTQRPIAVPSVSALCNSQDTWQVERVIRGQLESNGGGAVGAIRAALPISALIEYDRGINDGFTIGNTDIDLPGVPEGKVWLFVPNVVIVANKRPLTMDSGKGSVLELSTEERSWYHAQDEYFKDFLGSSFPGTALGDGYGFIVEVTLPTA
jgi:hypothetical protein